MRELVHCPGCGATMLEESFGSARVNVCAEGCRGIWFDAGELARLDTDRKGAGPHLRRALSTPRAERAAGSERRCPTCETPLREEAHPEQWRVEVDVCDPCGGVFLDAGELPEVRERSLTVDELLDAEDRRQFKLRRKRAAEREARNQRFADRQTFPLGLVLRALGFRD